MIYKAFLNRQEITGFPVKGKDVNKIYGGNILLWEKEEQIKEPFTVEAYFPSNSENGVINGNRFSGYWPTRKSHILISKLQLVHTTIIEYKHWEK